MRLSIFSILFLFSNIALTSDYIIRTKETGFYQISSNEIGILKSESTILGDVTINSAEGIRPYFFDSGNDTIQKADSLIFFAEALRGKHAKQHLLDDNNGFKISRSDNQLATDNWIFNSSTNDNLQNCSKIFTTDHYEANKLLIRVTKAEYKNTPELWYWKKLSYLLKKGFSVNFDISKSNLKSDLKLTTAIRGRNKDKKAKDVPDHQVQVLVNGVLVSTLEWNDKIQYIGEKITIPKEILKPENNTITYKVPKRKVDGKAIIDISMLDYFQITYEADPSKITGSDSINSDATCKLTLKENQVAYSHDNKHFSFDNIEINPDSKVYIGNKKQYKKPEIIKPQSLDMDFSKTEYLMISHPSFTETLNKFAEFYNKNGVKSVIVNTDQIYQNYSFGVRELYSIKQLIKDIHIQSNGKLKFVLLVGDSSWDWRDNGKQNKYAKWANKSLPKDRNFTNFPHQDSYTEEYINRDFLPTGQYHSSEGHSASDNWFVSIVPEENQKDEDFMPDLAIGRFPVSTNEELEGMISKTINYTKNTKVGPWKSRVLWITNSNKRYIARSIKNSNLIGDYGVSASTVFPKEMDGDNLKVQETLSNSFDEGNLVVHFVGHGGKSIWRVGPPDLNKNRDLFTLDNISGLNNSNTLPFVMSMSCYSAPFDHPFADSIGEKFIRQPEVGAIAVLASSWRNTPNHVFSGHVLENLFNKPELSIGQAVMEGKRRFKGRTMIEMYNLLGDPAVHLAIPTLKMESLLKNKKMEAIIDTNKFNGKAKIDLIDIDSNILSTHELSVTDTTFDFSFDEIPEKCYQGRIYAWDSKQNIDAMSSFDCKIQ